MPDVTARVRAGAAFLDEQDPGWDGKIRLWRLHVVFSGSCVFGQLYGKYERGARELFITSTRSAQLGFDADFTRGPVGTAMQYRALTRAWKKEIRARRAVRAGDIGLPVEQPLRRYEPIPDDVPEQEPSPQIAPVPVPEKVPA